MVAYFRYFHRNIYHLHPFALDFPTISLMGSNNPCLTASKQPHILMSVTRSDKSYLSAHILIDSNELQHFVQQTAVFPRRDILHKWVDIFHTADKRGIDDIPLPLVVGLFWFPPRRKHSSV